MNRPARKPRHRRPANGPDLDRLAAAVAAAPEGLSLSQVHRGVFKGALSAAEIRALVAQLRADGRAELAGVWREFTYRRKVEVVRPRAPGPGGEP